MNIQFNGIKKFSPGKKEESAVSTLNNWEENNNKLYRKIQFKDFNEAFAFMTKVALVAEKMDHHPEWKNVWNTVELWLSTHDAGDIVTEKDRKLAAKIDSFVP